MSTPVNDTVVFLSNARLSFPNIIEPQERVDAVTGKKRISYNCELLLERAHPGLSQFMQRCGAVAIEKWHENANNVMQMIQMDRKSRCYGAGEEKVDKKTFKPYIGYEGMCYISCGRDTPPQLIQADGKAIDPENTMAYQAIARKLYGGCRVNAAVRPWAQLANPAKQYGHGVRCDLIAIQFLKDDVPFGEGNVDASSMFGAVAAPQTSAPAAAPMPGMPFPASQAPATQPPAFAVPGMPSFMQGK